jgi:hypothetical protein
LILDREPQRLLQRHAALAWPAREACGLLRALPIEKGGTPDALFGANSIESELMPDQRDENVPRGDHVPAERQDENEAKRDEPGVDSASRRGHGAHGKGVGFQEERVDEANPTPDFSKSTDRGGSAGWGSEKSGGSVIDKRSPDNT